MFGAIAGIAGSLFSANRASKAAKRAGGMQAQFAQQGIDLQKDQFDQMLGHMMPYITAGESALGGQMDLLGLSGDGSQQAAIDQLKRSPMYGSLMQQGEDALLQNASATGGMRGGNLQGALSEFRPQLLSQLIESQYNKLGGMAGLGQASAAGLGQSGMGMANSVGNLLNQQGAARAGGAMARGGRDRMIFGDMMNIGSMIPGLF